MSVRRTNAFDALRTALRGAVLSPQDDGFQSACSPWNRAVRQRPAVVVRAAQPDDVVTAVRFAANQRPPIAVQAAGHGARIPADGALLVDTSALAGVEVDPAANRARIGAGARLVDVVLAALDSSRMSGQFWATPSAERDGAASPTISSIALPTWRRSRRSTFA